MNAFLRVLHVLAVAVWFGSVVFFTLSGVLIFGAFQEASAPDASHRPAWFPVAQLYAGESPGPGFPDPLRLEQGSRAAGTAVGAIFPVYYALQAGCAVVVLLTALLLARSGEGGAHGWRTSLAAVALASVLAGWWLEGEVSRLRQPRNDLTDLVLSTASPSSEQVEAARNARADFGRWHGFSLLQNFTTLALAGGLTLLVPALSRPGPGGVKSFA